MIFGLSIKKCFRKMLGIELAIHTQSAVYRIKIKIIEAWEY